MRTLLFLIPWFLTVTAWAQVSVQPGKTNPLTPKYQRQHYKHWIDTDGDCQNTRAEILIATSIEPVTFKSSQQCTVKSGFWVDPYSGKAFTNAQSLDIDHIVPLQFAHTHGAADWPSSQKKDFANDPLNIIPVYNSLNRQKGSKPPEQWLPPNPSFVCDYLEKWIFVAKKYKLHSSTKLSDHKKCQRIQRNLSSKKRGLQN